MYVGRRWDVWTTVIGCGGLVPYMVCGRRVLHGVWYVRGPVTVFVWTPPEESSDFPPDVARPGQSKWNEID